MTNWLEVAQAFIREKFQSVHIKKDPVAHALEVCRLLRDEFAIADTEILTAGILHDVLEDTHVMEDELRQTFSARTAELVKAVSHEKGHEYDREAFYESLKSAPLDAKCIKLAEAWANLEWMLGCIQGGAPVFHSHEPYLRHVKMFVSACLDPSLIKIDQKITQLCSDISRMDRKRLRAEEALSVGDI